MFIIKKILKDISPFYQDKENLYFMDKYSIYRGGEVLHYPIFTDNLNKAKKYNTKTEVKAALKLLEDRFSRNPNIYFDCKIEELKDNE